VSETSRQREAGRWTRFTAAVRRWTRPKRTSVALGLLADLFRPRAVLAAENAMLRQQIVVLRRSVKRPRITRVDRLMLLLAARFTPSWRQALHLIRPETLLRWHRDVFSVHWRRRSRLRLGRPSLDADVVALIREMATNNRLWGAERIRGELLKVGIRVSKRTVQKYMRPIRRRRPGGQTWPTFLHNHARETWACDFLQLHDVFFRPIFAFFIIEHERRRIVHLGVTRHPTQAWVAQQLREATPFGEAPRFLIRDRDDKFGTEFDLVAVATSIRVLRTAVRAPKMNAICERFLGSVRRECLDHVIILGERQLQRVLEEYVDYFHRRPHQGIAQETPEPLPPAPRADPRSVTRLPVLGGLHHDYRAAA